MLQHKQKGTSGRPGFGVEPITFSKTLANVITGDCSPKQLRIEFKKKTFFSIVTDTFKFYFVLLDIS